MGRFSFISSPVPGSGVLKNDKLRITVLTPCLLRLEVGSYTDMPTQTVWNRNFEKVEYTTHKVGNLFSIYTKEATFCIDLGKRAMQSVILHDGTVVTDFEKGNLMGTARTLDMVNGATKLEKGILSRSGVAVMDDSKSLLLQQDGKILPRSKCSDLYYFAYGHDYLRCLKDFFRLTGNVPKIPKYALGNWWSRYRAYTQSEYQALMEQFIQRKIPVTVATIDMDWHWTDVYDRFGKEADPGKGNTRQEKWYNSRLPGWTGYSWNRELFPDHPGLLRWLKENGFHITLNVHPSQGIRYYEDCYSAVCEKMGVSPETKTRIPFDIANPRFVETYLDDAHHPYEEEGADFWWLDWQQGKTTAIPGLDPLWALNHYHTLDNCRDGKQGLILSRYAGLGSHRYPLGFSGDTFSTWESLHFQPYFTNTAANAGYTWWSHDIGGHQFGKQDDELYVRWLQYGVFSPINRLHSTCNDYMGKEPWKRSYAAAKISEDFLRLRQKLIPYLHAASYKTHLEGIPVCMPMYYAYDRDEAYEVPNQYIFGSQLMVCPITAPMHKDLNLGAVKAWLPEGRWTDFFTDQIYQGGRWVTLHRDLDSIPVLAGEGSIVPMYESGESNDLSLDQPLEIHLWRGSGEYDLYEDDGGAYAVTKLKLLQQQGMLRFTIEAPAGNTEILPQQRQMTLRFRDVVSADVTVNGIPTEWTGDTVTVPVIVCKDTVVVELSNVVALTNRPRKELQTDLLTRVQWSNHRKSQMFTEDKFDKLPGFLKDALAELDAME